MIKDERIDNGKAFDWGRASADYASYRDIYPPLFYERIIRAGLCIKGQKVLDLGTGTGVLPRNLYQYGAEFTATDISENQIKEAIRLSQAAGMKITYQCTATEELDFPENSFDVITACQCFFYFNHEQIAEKLYKILKPGGKLLLLYMAWLPEEDRIAGASEALVLKYNKDWSGRGEYRHNIEIPPIYHQYFQTQTETHYDLQVPFTRETWNGRIKACRGIGASLSPDQIAAFTQEHQTLLKKTTPPTFQIQHYAAMTILTVSK